MILITPLGNYYRIIIVAVIFLEPTVEIPQRDLLIINKLVSIMLLYITKQS